MQLPGARSLRRLISEAGLAHQFSESSTNVAMVGLLDCSVGSTRNKVMKSPKLQPLRIAVTLFVVVYIPAFAATALIRPSVQTAIPLIIGISL
jgi:hypothetical protein